MILVYLNGKSFLEGDVAHANSSAPGCIASHARVPGSIPAGPTWVLQRNIFVSTLDPNVSR